MKIFISWSGMRSQKLANKLRGWLPLVLQNVTPYMSSGDIPAGTRWLRSVSSELDTCNFGILCITPENLRAPWIHFEAGALSKALDNSHVVPMLFVLTRLRLDGQPPGRRRFSFSLVGAAKSLATETQITEPREAHAGACVLPAAKFQRLFFPYHLS
jgi:hypothetical protein